MSNQCSKCDREAVIHREYEGRSLCEDHFKRSVEKQFKKTIRKHNLVQDGDRIALGLSGGKDSAVLLHLLEKVFGQRPDVDLVAIAVDEGIENYRFESIEAARELCEDRNISLELVKFSEMYDLTVDEVAEKADRPACTVCGVLRRSALNQKARELDADKIAIGHNLDDEAQTILMNHLRGDVHSLKRTGFRNDYLENENLVTRIKPLEKIPEKEVALYSRLENLGVIDECPHVRQDLLRPSVKKFLNEMQSKMPGVKFSLVSQGHRIAEDLDLQQEKPDLTPCRICGEPSSEEVCRKCQYIKQFREEDDLGE